MYSSIAHSCTNNTVVAGYHDSRRNTDTPYRSLWRYICSSCARAGVFPGIPACTGKQVYRHVPVNRYLFTGTCRYTGLPVCPVYRFFLVLPLQAGKSGHRLYHEQTVKHRHQRMYVEVLPSFTHCQRMNTNTAQQEYATLIKFCTYVQNYTQAPH